MTALRKLSFDAVVIEDHMIVEGSAVSVLPPVAGG